MRLSLIQSPLFTHVSPMLLRSEALLAAKDRFKRLLRIVTFFEVRSRCGVTVLIYGI